MEIGSVYYYKYEKKSLKVEQFAMTGTKLLFYSNSYLCQIDCHFGSRLLVKDTFGKLTKIGETEFERSIAKEAEKIV